MLASPAPAPSPTHSTAAGAAVPAWHTAIVLAAIAGMGVFSLTSRSIGGHRLRGYCAIMVFEWLTVGFIALGARWGGASLKSLAGALPGSWPALLRDAAIAAGFLVASNIALAMLSHVLSAFMPPQSSQHLKDLLPRTLLENLAFLPLSLTAGFCEEMIFRGYLQHQFTAWTRSMAVGLALQSLCFGAAHAYQGGTMVIVISVYGCLFGLLASWRRSLRPGMMAHFAQDAIGGLILSRFAAR